MIAKLATHGCATTHLLSKSVSNILLNFPIPIKIQSARGIDPPDKPVPAPLGTTLIFLL